MMQDSLFMEKLLEEVYQKIERLKQIVLSDKQKEKIKEYYYSKCKDDADLQQVMITNQGPGKKDSQQPIYKVINFAIGDKKPIMSCYGTFFAQHGEVDNFTSLVVDYLIKSRKVIKKEMFTYPEDSDEFMVLDNKQKVFKVMGNSFYGVLCQAAFILYNKLMGPSVTYQGVGIITSAIMAMEGYLGNNIRFLDYDDILTFVNNVVSEKSTNKIRLPAILDKDKIKTRKELVQYLIGMSDFSLTPEQKTSLTKIIGGLSIDMVNRVYYKRNMEDLFLHKKMMKLFSDCMPKEGDTFADVHEPFDYHKPDLENLYGILDEIVAYKYAYHNREQRSQTMRRKSVVIVDTDSTFLYLDPMYQLISDYWGKSQEERKDDEYRINVCNVLTYFCHHYMQTYLDVFTGNCNIGEKHQPLINMKSEFLMKRVLLTKNKKQYASIVLVQEGNVYKVPKLDLKGMSIKKVSVNKSTREYFTEMIQNEILAADKIKLDDILLKYYDYEQELKDGISGASMDYLLPSKFNSIGAYQIPARIAAVRGRQVWNALNPEEQINDFEKVKLLRTTISSMEDLGDEVPDEIKEIIQAAHFDDSSIAHFNVILAIPLIVESVPEWIKPYIALDEMVATNLTAAMPIVETIGYEVIEYKAKKYYTNVVAI